MRYFVGFLITIGLIILLIMLLFGGGGAKVPSTTKSLVSYANTNAVVQMTIDGPINDPADHVQVQITVGRDGTTYDQIQGYDGSVVKQQTYGNSLNSYTAFLHALYLAGFTQGNTDASVADERGYCPLGDRYIFQLTQYGKVLERFWSTSCGQKSYRGNTLLTLDLFKAQVSNYDELTNSLIF